MRRMLRILKSLGLGLSALLCIATLVLWVRSVDHFESALWRRFDINPAWQNAKLLGFLGPFGGRTDRSPRGTLRDWELWSARGRIWFSIEHRAPYRWIQPTLEHSRDPLPPTDQIVEFETEFEPGQREWEGGISRCWRLGLIGIGHACSAIAPETGHPYKVFYSFSAPHWVLAVIFGLWPTVVLTRRLLRRKRPTAGHCPACGYDLRATPDPNGPTLDRCPECGLLTPTAATATADTAHIAAATTPPSAPPPADKSAPSTPANSQ